MIADCEEGKIDLVITKSISRFARNTQDSLNYTRRLKERGIGILFEKEGINTMDSAGELLLTLFSCFAQEESRSISENTAWGIRSRFRQGIPHLNTDLLFGYCKGDDGKLAIDEAQAVTVRQIYRMFLEGSSLNGIAAILNKEQIAGVHGKALWCAATIQRILENEKYKGALLMQKTYTVSYLTKRHARNNGQLEQYYIEHNHPPIIASDEWEAAQEELERRKAFRTAYGLRGLNAGGSPFSSRLLCASCKHALRRVFHHGVRKPFWRCEGCGTRIGEEALRAAFCTAFNSLVVRREELERSWSEIDVHATPLARLRNNQMRAVIAEGILMHEVPELTQAVLQEAWVLQGGVLRFKFLCGEEVEATMNREKEDSGKSVIGMETSDSIR